jgi:hypothetical protein
MRLVLSGHRPYVGALRLSTNWRVCIGTALACHSIAAKPFTGCRQLPTRVTQRRWERWAECTPGGEGVPTNSALARSWAAKAAAAGLRASQTQLGAMLLTGFGGPPDTDEGIYWMKIAAQRGDADAAVALQQIGAIRTKLQLALSILSDGSVPDFGRRQRIHRSAKWHALRPHRSNRRHKRPDRSVRANQSLRGGGITNNASIPAGDALQSSYFRAMSCRSYDVEIEMKRDWVKLERGGAGGIRTLDTVLPYTHFPGERLRPLGHRSAFRWKGAHLR